MYLLANSEARKFISTPRWWLIGAGMVLASMALSALLTFVALGMERSPLDLSRAEDIGSIVNVASGMTFVFSIALGVLIVTAEYTDGTMAQTLLAGRDPWRVYVAKVAAGLGFGIVLAIATLATCLAVVAAFLLSQGQSLPLTNPEVVGRIGGGTAVLSLWAVVGVGVGALVRNQVVALVGLVVFTQVFEPILRIALPATSNFLPGAVAESASGGSIVTLALGNDGLSQVAALTVMAIGAAIVAWAGGYRFATNRV